VVLSRVIGVSQDYVQGVTENEMAEAHRREARFRADQPAMVVEARTALIVDDGLATGATMRAAVRSVRQRHPARLVVAVPVGSVDACEALRAEADDVVCLNAPIDFVAVGYYFRNFAPVEDEAVVRMLDEARSASAVGAETHAQ
jgi:predicted phosphoribosyltransferase